MPTMTFSQAMASLREGASPPVALGILRYLQHYPRERQRLSEGDLHLLTTTDDHQRALAEYYCGLWNDLDDAGLEPSGNGVAKVDAELADSPWVIVFDGGRWQTRHVDEMAGDGGDHPTRFAAQRAPKGYTNERPMVIGGKKFRGGQWIPSEQMKRATPEQKAEIEGAASGHAEKRRQRGNVDVAGLKKKLAPHAGHELSKHETTSARRSFGALLHHHGGLVVHRLEEMANDLHAAMEGADDGARGQFSRRLAAVNQMLGWAHEKGHEGKVGDGDAVKEEAATEKAPPSKAEPKDAPETADAPNYFELPSERGESATPTKEESKEAPNYFELPSEREDAAKAAAAKPPPPAAPPKETPAAKPVAPAVQPGHRPAAGPAASSPTGGEAKVKPSSVDSAHAAYESSGQLTTPNSRINAAVKSVAEMPRRDLDTLAGKMELKTVGMSDPQARYVVQERMLLRRGSFVRSMLASDSPSQRKRDAEAMRQAGMNDEPLIDAQTLRPQKAAKSAVIPPPREAQPPRPAKPTSLSPAVAPVAAVYEHAGNLGVPNSKINAGLRAIDWLDKDQVAQLAAAMEMAPGSTKRQLHDTILARRNSMLRSRLTDRSGTRHSDAYNDEPLGGGGPQGASPVDHRAAEIAKHAAKIGTPGFDFAALKKTMSDASSLKAADVGHLANKLKVSYPKGTTKRELLARIERSVSERQATHERVQQIAGGPEAEKESAKPAPPNIADTPPPKLAEMSGSPTNGKVKVAQISPTPDGRYPMWDGGARKLPGAVGPATHVAVHGDGYMAQRYFYHDQDGKVVCRNESSEMKERGKGRGLAIFANQVDALRKAGVDRVSLTAEGNAADSEFNGYYTWARFGADGPIPDGTRVKLPPDLRAAKSVQDLMATPAGREAWKKYGQTFDGTFSLQDGSRSMEALKGYMREKAAAKPVPTTVANTPAQAPPAKSTPPPPKASAAPKSLASPGPIAGTLQYASGKIPTPKQAGLSPEQEKATEKSLRNAYSTRSTFRGNETGLIPMDHLYADMQRDNPGLTREQFHAVVNKLWDSKKVELHILNEQRQLEDGQEHATMFLKDSDGGTKGYHYLYLKPQR